MPSIAPMPRIERRLMQKTIYKTRDKNHARRLTAMLMLDRGDRVSDVARTLCCTRSSVGCWINWFTLSGAEGLKYLPAGRARRWLPSAGLVCRRAAPTLRIRDPNKDEKMAAIHKALDECRERLTSSSDIKRNLQHRGYVSGDDEF